MKQLLFVLIATVLLNTSVFAQATEHDGHEHHTPKDSTTTEISCPMGSNCDGGIGVCEIRPNPCNDIARIHLMAPENAHVRVTIFSSNMSRVRTLTDHVVTGDIEAVWDGRDDAGNLVSAGVYFCQMICTAEANATMHNHPIRNHEMKKILLTR